MRKRLSWLMVLCLAAQIILIAPGVHAGPPAETPKPDIVDDPVPWPALSDDPDPTGKRLYWRCVQQDDELVCTYLYTPDVRENSTVRHREGRRWFTQHVNEQVRAGKIPHDALAWGVMEYQEDSAGFTYLSRPTLLDWDWGPAVACDSTSICEMRCEAACDAAGHGDQVCNSEVTQREDGKLCSADCGPCGSTPTAICIIECGEPVPPGGG